MALTLKQFRQKISDILDNTINRELTDKIGRHVSTAVKKRTRKGFGVADTGGKKERLKPLKTSTKRRRKELKGKGRLSGETTPGKSNLTRSGRMLNNIGYQNSKDEVTVQLKGKEKLKAQDVSKERPFMNLSKTEIREVVKIVEQEFINDIKKKGL